MENKNELGLTLLAKADLLMEFIMNGLKPHSY
jgi:hypothetical protein